MQIKISLHTSICLLLLLCTRSVLSLWDFAVTTKSKILFYDDNWREITSSAHQFDQLSAITFDETEEVVYFNDQLHNNGSIFSLKIPTLQDDPHIIENIVQRTQKEAISGIAYDPVERNLYWTDTQNRKIYVASIDRSPKSAPQVLLDLANEDALPDGLAIDICRRKLYWTNSFFKNASVERIDLDGRERRQIVGSELYLPHGIVVDQLSDRIYWVVDQQGVYFSVESADLDGGDRRVVVQGLNNVPFNLAVTRDTIYWTDSTYNAVWSFPKFGNGSTDDAEESHAHLAGPRNVHSFAQQPRGIVARTNFLTTLLNDEQCSKVVHMLRRSLLAPKPTRNPVDVQVENLQRQYCLNDGEYSTQSGMCVCRVGFKGLRCEQSECQNYCVHGNCAMSSMGFPKCTCQHGFYGERCQSYKCARFCLNDGHCKIEESGEATCECKENFGGQRCEHNSTEICSLYCRILKHEPETFVPFGCHDICEELSLQGEEGTDSYAIPQYKHLQVCRNTVNRSTTVIIVLVSGVVACMLLVVLLVHGLRRIYKPARPRIKKTFVVRKQAANSSDTPLTNRPLTTEQCEITIENCCNMNICETPCFDPRVVVQQSLPRDSRVKEDKKMLIQNMEDELY